MEGSEAERAAATGRGNKWRLGAEEKNPSGMSPVRAARDSSPSPSQSFLPSDFQKL